MTTEKPETPSLSEVEAEMAAAMEAEEAQKAEVKASETTENAPQANTAPAEEAPADGDNLYSAVGNLSQQLQMIETFVSRRFDEISMEINATSQQVDMAEEGIIGKFTDILEVLKAISFSGNGKTPANAGVELDAVVDITEDATNKILDHATRTAELVSDAKLHWEDPVTRQNNIEAIATSMDEIVMACSFQDITGQRIRTTLENLREIEDRLNNALTKMGIVVEVSAPEDHKTWVANQDDIDSLFE